MRVTKRLTALPVDARMKVGDTIDFTMPGTDEFRTGRVEEFMIHEGTRMPVITDHRDSQYPVHPANITDALPA